MLPTCQGVFKVFWLVQRYLNSHCSCFGNKEIRGTFEKGCAAYASNRSSRLLGDGPTNQPAKGQMALVVAAQLHSSMRCWRGGSSTWSFVSHHQDTSTVPHQGFILHIHSRARAFTGERQKLGDGGVAAPLLKGLEGERLMLRGFVVLFILL